MKDKDYSWKGSWNAGVVLSVLAGIGALMILLVGFSN